MSAIPDWCEPLPDARQMRAIDRWAIEERGVLSLELMERAGTAVARAVERLAPDGPVAVVCGKGNNGGDGLVAARLLRQAGRGVTVLSVALLDQLTGDAAENLARLPGEAPLMPGVWGAGAGAGAGAAVGEGAGAGEGEGAGAGAGAGEGEGARSAARVLSEAAAVVDALLGTGSRGAPRGAVAEAIGAVNASSAPVVAVDVPSGVDASSGAVPGVAVEASHTVTLHAAKPGLWIHPGKARCGEVERVDIGIPRGAPAQASVGLIRASVLELLPRRGPHSTKFSSGHVLVVGGSWGLTGAPRMSALGAMRAGGGYVTACVPRSVQAILAGAGTPELMTRGLEDEQGALGPASIEAVIEAAGAGAGAGAGRGGAIALGPGLGRGAAQTGFARGVAARAPVAMVLDADALNAHAGHLEELASRPAPTVLTPHAGELARLLETSSEEVERARLEHARRAAERARAVVVLKGDDTLIAHPDGRVAVSPGGSPALATAGTGDVLSGVIAALLAQGLEPLEAAAAGVWLHLQAGRAAARAVGSAEGVIASDVIAALPAVRGGAGA